MGESEPGKGRWKKKHFESRRKKESNNNNNKDDGTGDTGEEWGIYVCEGKGKGNRSIFFFFSLFFAVAGLKRKGGGGFSLIFPSRFFRSFPLAPLCFLMHPLSFCFFVFPSF